MLLVTISIPMYAWPMMANGPTRFVDLSKETFVQRAQRQCNRKRASRTLSPASPMTYHSLRPGWVLGAQPEIYNYCKHITSCFFAAAMEHHPRWKWKHPLSALLTGCCQVGCILQQPDFVFIYDLESRGFTNSTGHTKQPLLADTKRKPCDFYRSSSESSGPGP